MTGNNFFFNDREGSDLSPKTCHPLFVKTLRRSFYYDPTDELSPFGNDDGSDLLQELEDRYREGNEENIVQWLLNNIDEYGFPITAEACYKLLDPEILRQMHEQDNGFLESMDRLIVATAFGQFRITGNIDSELKSVALIAVERQLQLSRGFKAKLSAAHKERLEIMHEDLMRIE